MTASESSSSYDDSDFESTTSDEQQVVISCDDGIPEDGKHNELGMPALSTPRSAPMTPGAGTDNELGMLAPSTPRSAPMILAFTHMLSAPSTSPRSFVPQSALSPIKEEKQAEGQARGAQLFQPKSHVAKIPAKTMVVKAARALAARALAMIIAASLHMMVARVRALEMAAVVGTSGNESPTGKKAAKKAARGAGKPCAGCHRQRR